jgi:manganese transport protein
MRRVWDPDARMGSLSQRTVAAASDVLAGRRGGLRAYLAFVGPAVVASIAYMDPGNFATNIQAGARYGYTLLWVVLLANIIAMLFQALSAKLGIVTGRNLAEMCREQFPRPVVWSMWVVSEVAAMATDLAEFLGGAIGLSLLFGLPLLYGMIVTGMIVYGILLFERFGFRPVELIIGNFVAVIALCYLIQMFIAPVDWRAAAVHTVVPHIADAGALLLTVGIIGATVMPHAVYLHSGLARDRHGHPEPGRQRRWLLKVTRLDVGLAMLVAGAVNLSMLLVAATNLQGRDNTDSIEGAHAAVRDTLGPTIALFFAIGLLASGLASTSVGAYAGAMIMQGLLRRSYPLLLRRLVTLIPALAILAIGVDPSRALVLSQVVLSFGIPFALIPLVRLTSNRSLMGEDTNHRVTTALGWSVAMLISLLNVVLIYLTVAA